MAGLIGMGNRHRGTSMDVYSGLARDEREREHANRQLDDQRRARRTSSMAQGAGIGFTMGGPVGAVIGAGVGYLASEVF